MPVLPVSAFTAAISRLVSVTRPVRGQHAEVKSPVGYRLRPPGAIVMTDAGATTARTKNWSDHEH